MQAIATIKYIRTSPKKLRELAKASRGMAPDKAIDRLIIQGSKAARLLAKVIKSAKMNAVNNSRMGGDLQIQDIEIGKGPMFKRFQPVSRGMAHEIKKRTSHIKVIVVEAPGTAKQLPKAEPVKTVENSETAAVQTDETKAEKTTAESTIEVATEEKAEKKTTKKPVKKVVKKSKPAKK